MKEFPYSSDLLISEDGKVFSRSLNRFRVLTINAVGYPVFSFKSSCDGKRITYLLHRAVAETFLGPIPKGKVVNHKNGIKSDCSLSNLEVVTYRENSIHAAEILGIDFSFGKRQLTEEMLLTVATLKGIMSLKEISKDLKVPTYLICGLHSGRRYKEFSKLIEKRPSKSIKVLYRKRGLSFMAYYNEGRRQKVIGSFPSMEEARNATLRFERKNRNPLDAL